MFCEKCGAVAPDGSQFCNHCGHSFSSSVQPPPVATAVPPPTQVVPPAADAPTSGKALASMISGIFGLLFFFPAIAAIILGHISRSEIRESNGRLRGGGMAVAGLVMGYGVFLLIPFILILAAIAIPNLLRARIAANESSAVASIRKINTAERAYRAEFPAIGFACELNHLGGSSESQPSAENARFIDRRLSAGEKTGYRFSVENCENSEAEHKYQIVATPMARNTTGRRTFCSDESGVVKWGESASECLENGTPLQ
jgi:type IV pilus assembly protein PilA